MSGRLRIDVVTLFPRMFAGPLDESIIGRARDRGLLDIRVHDLRDYTHDRHRTADDRPFGGGPGMVMRAEPLFEAVEDLAEEGTRVILMTPQGRTLCQAVAGELSAARHLVIVCGHYEGVDDRVREGLVDDEISIGDYVLTSGVLPALVLIDAVGRLVPGVVGHPEATAQESFASGRLEYPQYTRPAVFRGMAVPDILLSGDHGEISRWREDEALRRTRLRRPDLLGDKDHERFS